MALFGKKKSEAPAPASSSSTPAPADTGAFDFDAISRDLDAQNGASSFDALLSQPALSQPANTTPTNTAPTPATTTTNSAFDFPEGDPLQTNVVTPPIPSVAPPIPVVAPQPSHVPTVAVVPEGAPVAPLPQTVVNAPLSPPVVVDSTPSAPAPVEVPVGRVRPAFKPKKSFPLIPLLGTLGALAVLGGGAMFLLNSQKEPLDDETPVVVRPRVAKRPPVAPSAAQSNVAPPAQPNAVAPRPAATQTRAVIVLPPGGKVIKVPASTLRSGTPGIAPPVATKRPLGALRPRRTAQVPVRVAKNPFASPPAVKSNAPSATAGLDVGLASRLKALWRAGADAKHRGNFKQARASWEEALRLRPGHPGFREAISKLPK